eukprot:TRINITY_DN33012_c0_g1_i1.p1 TRINITY_DN33012_c0_g1~~TRINITY_DN33012_c0_g1_i1.p1  ORF type:complete len:279 (+),score=54.92 TRINITY_DN33012_c0_g1_i1:60-839(+)
MAEDSDSEPALDLFAEDASLDDAETDTADPSAWEVIPWTDCSASADVPHVYISRFSTQCWASARMTAEWLLGSDGRQVLAACCSAPRQGLCIELGAALALPSLAASAAGGMRRCVASDVTGEDGMSRAIRKTRAMLKQPDLFENVEWRRVDWNQAADDLAELREAGDLVICADAIYATKAAEPLARAADLALAPGGTLIFSSRLGRNGLADFLRIAQAERPQGCALNLVSQTRLCSTSMQLGLEEDEEHALWTFTKPAT